MKINWQVRLKNKAWLLSMAAAVIAFVYQVCGLLGVVPPISEDMATQIIGMVANVLVALGIVVDPTTSGVTDSSRALEYDKPNKE